MIKFSILWISQDENPSVRWFYLHIILFYVFHYFWRKYCVKKVSKRVFTFVLVTEVTEVSGAGYCHHLPDAGWGPTGNDVPHALATCQEETITLRRHHSYCDGHTHTHTHTHTDTITLSNHVLNMTQTVLCSDRTVRIQYKLEGDGKDQCADFKTNQCTIM